MAPEAHIVHSTVNRLRIKIPSRKGNGEYFSRLQTFFRQQPGFDRVEINPLTASLLIEARGEVRPFFDAVEEVGKWFRLRESRPMATPLSQKMVQGFRAVDAQVEHLTGGELDLSSIALAGLVCAGIYQISIGNFAAPAWYTAFWYAASIAVKSDRSSKSNSMM